MQSPVLLVHRVQLRQLLHQPLGNAMYIIESSWPLAIQLQHCCGVIQVSHQAWQTITLAIDQPVTCRQLTDGPDPGQRLQVSVQAVQIQGPSMPN